MIRTRTVPCLASFGPTPGSSSPKMLLVSHSFKPADLLSSDTQDQVVYFVQHTCTFHAPIDHNTTWPAKIMFQFSTKHQRSALCACRPALLGRRESSKSACTAELQFSACCSQARSAIEAVGLLLILSRLLACTKQYVSARVWCLLDRSDAQKPLLLQQHWRHIPAAVVSAAVCHSGRANHAHCGRGR